MKLHPGRAGDFDCFPKNKNISTDVTDIICFFLMSVIRFLSLCEAPPVLVGDVVGLSCLSCPVVVVSCIVVVVFCLVIVLV